MTTKLLEIRDSATRISVLAIRFDPADDLERAIFAQNGYGSDIEGQSRYVMLVRINGGETSANYDPYAWGTSTRTMFLAHQHILAHFNELETGDVVDVRYYNLFGQELVPPDQREQEGDDDY